MNNADQVAVELTREVMDRIAAAVERAKEVLIRETVNVIDDYYEREGKLVSTGAMRKGIRGDVEQTALTFIARVFPGVNYGLAAHEGTKPHKVPVETIAKWITRKKLAGKWRDGGTFQAAIKRRGSIAKMSEDADTLSAARAIARKIARKGTKGVKFFDIAMRNAEPEILKELQAF